ncbi:MAG: T9SS type A sorting domain-containing protein [Saprospiraceae bacterium]|nr:T9SS type A sorting domain-containing protein [Saprospiraceae bacterium]
MKNLQHLLWIFIALIIYTSELSGQCNNCTLYAADPKQPWKRTDMYIDNVSMVVKPAGKFYHLDLYMTYQINDPQNFKVQDTFEVVHYFGLPANGAITDSWLWVEDVIMKADILDRYSAFNIYEGIVNRRKDPSVLYKNSSEIYEYRIFPLPAKKSRRVKLSFLIAVNEFNNIDLPLGLLKNSYPRPDVNVIVYDKDTQLNPAMSNGAPFIQNNHPELGTYRSAIIKAADYDETDGKYSGIDFKLEQTDVDLFLATAFENGTNKEGVFQLSLQPSKILGLDALERNKFVFVLDYHLGNSLYTKDEMIAALKFQIRSLVKEGDYFRVLYNQLSAKEVSEEWISYNNLENLDDILSTVQLGNTSIIGSLLYEAYYRVKDENNGKLIVMSSDANVVSGTAAQSLKDELKAQFGELRQTFILDFARYNQYNKGTFYYGIYYYGNELLYKILSSNTNGSYVTMAKEGQKTKLYEYLSELNNSIIEAQFDFIDYYIRPEEGICYDIYPIKNGNRIIQVGKFRGKLPFTLEITALFRDSLIYNTYIVENEAQPSNYTFFSQGHAMGKILDIEKNGTIPKNQVFTLIQTSIENRVLCRNTAFLALEPGLQEPCFDCEDESNTTVSVEDQDLNQKVLTAAPNPFRNALTIQLKGVEDASDIEKTELIDLTGRVTTLTLDWSRGENGLVAEMDSTDLQSGMYILRITVKGRVYILKIVKA